LKDSFFSDSYTKLSKLAKMLKAIKLKMISIVSTAEHTTKIEANSIVIVAKVYIKPASQAIWGFTNL